MNRIFLKTIPAWLLVAFFVVGGIINLLALGETAQDYQRWGYPSWFHFVTGILELATAALLAYRPYRLWGAALGSAAMLGACGTLLFHGEYAHAIPSIVVLALLLFVASSIARPRSWLR